MDASHRSPPPASRHVLGDRLCVLAIVAAGLAGNLLLWATIGQLIG
jgi:hypothetical protein